jgi:hypothetical protein
MTSGVAHRTGKRWVIVPAKRVKGRARIRVRRLSVFDGGEQVRYAVETMNLPYDQFLARKADFAASGCDLDQPRQGGCRKPFPYNSFDWTDDGCSPSWVPDELYRSRFDGPCQQHDFGYRNFGNGLALGRDETTRAWIDRRFFVEMSRRCRSSGLAIAICHHQAGAVWAAVRHLGRSAFYRPLPFPEPGRPAPDVPDHIDPLPPITTPPQTPLPPAPVTSRRILTVDNRVTNAMGMREDDLPARLLTQPWTHCTARGCNIYGTERSSGQTYDAAVCQTHGERTTNGDDGDPRDDANPLRFESTRYYGVRLTNGVFGYVSEAWIRADFRGGLGLPAC